MSGDPFDDTQPQPVLRLEGAGAEVPAEPAALPGAPGGPASGDASVLPARATRSRGRWVVAAVTVTVAALCLGAAGYLLTRQAPAAASPPEAAGAIASDDPSTWDDIAPSGVAGTSSTAPLSAGQDTLVLGDSLALDVYPYLADLVPDRYVSYVGEVGSGTAWAVDQVQQLQQQGEKIPRVVVVSAGTNDWYASDFRRDATRLLELLGPKRCVAWSTIARPATVNGTTVDPADDLNKVLQDLAADHPNLRLLDWTGLAAQHEEWLVGDGIHPDDDGTIARASLFADASLACSPLDPDAPVADQQYLPPSAFYPGGSTATSGTSGTSGTTTTSGSGGYTPAPDPTPKQTKSRSPKPTTTPSADPTPTKSEPVPPPTEDDSPVASDPPSDGGGGGDGG